MLVNPGPALQFSVFGFATANGASDCTALSSALPRANFSSPFLIGSTTQDIAGSTESVSITVDWTGAIKMDTSNILTTSGSPIVLSGGPTYSYGPFVTGFSYNATFTLSNSGNVPATGLAATGLSGPFSFKGGSYPGTGGTCATSLAPSSNCTVVVTYSPTAPGVLMASLRFNYLLATSASSISIALSGTGAPPVTNGYGTCTLRDSYTSADFPPTPVGAAPQVGQGYATQTLSDTSSYSSLASICTDTVMANLMHLYCAAGYTNTVQWESMTFSSSGSVQTSGCVASGCSSHSCQ